MKAQIISFHCIMKNKLGQVLSTSFNQDVINQRSGGNDRLPGLVDGLQEVHVGEKRQITLPANVAYGSYDPRLVVELKRAELDYSNQLKHGSQILRFDESSSEKRLFRVIRLDDETVVLDGNHPLAGHDLVFEVEITSAREFHDTDLIESSALLPNHLVH